MVKRKPYITLNRFTSDLGIDMAKPITVYGYYKTLGDKELFVYYHNKDCKWYVIDSLIGLAVSSGHSMQEAEESFYKLNDYYTTFKKTKKYKSRVKEYSKIIKEGGVEYDN